MKEFFIDLVNEYDERFTMAQFMSYEGDNYDPLTSHVMNNIKSMKPKGKIVVRGTGHRPDVLSHIIYSDVQFWWVLMLYNDFMSVDDIKEGMDVIYPDISDIEDMYFTLKIKQDNR